MLYYDGVRIEIVKNIDFQKLNQFRGQRHKFVWLCEKESAYMADDKIPLLKIKIVSDVCVIELKNHIS